MSEKSTPIAPVKIIQDHIDAHGFLSWLDMRVEEVDYGRLVMTIPFDEKLTNHSPNEDRETSSPLYQIHGGIAATLVDTVGGIVLWPYLDDPLEGNVATINLNVNYLRPATGDLTATAEVVRAGQSVGVSTMTVKSESSDSETKPVVVGQGAYRLFQS
jgi:uncharacterized protein (TIGR00369 family)